MIQDVLIRNWYVKNRKSKNNKAIKILGVEYAHVKLKNGDDIYFTKYGLPFIDVLMPKNYWTDKKWFKNNSIKLSGTSSIYKVRTKKIKGKQKDIVLKWNRMGQDIPGAEDSDELLNADFNSPFEEVSLTMELRDTVYNHPTEAIIIQKPLAIYVPAEPVEFSRTGRKEYKMQLKISSHKEIVLDMCRSYAVIYEWIKGIDLAQTFNKGIINEAKMKLLTLESYKKIINNGFDVKDSKPHHVIVRPKNKKYLIRNVKGEILSALIDFELLERTPEKENILKKAKRTDYLKRQKDRFKIESPKKLHPHLSHVNIYGVEYVYGHVESTKGRLWVAGKDPYLFDYFLPEQWKQTHRTKISLSREMYYTITKDNIHLVWKVSNIGQKPDMDPFKTEERKILDYGYNSPFEEISIAIKLSKEGIPAIYPRAIYMTGNKIEIPNNLKDNSRYKTHKNIHMPDGIPILERNHIYIVIWGYWNGPDDKLANKDGEYYNGIDILHAYKDGIISKEKYIDLIKTAKDKLRRLGFEDLDLRGNHLLISFDNKGKIVMNKRGKPEIRICNFEFIKKLKK